MSEFIIQKVAINQVPQLQKYKEGFLLSKQNKIRPRRNSKFSQVTNSLKHNTMNMEKNLNTWKEYAFLLYLFSLLYPSR